MRKHLDDLQVRENKLKKKSEREKSFKISGIKMFNHPEMTPRAAGASTNRNKNNNSQRNSQAKMSSKEKQRIEVFNSSIEIQDLPVELVNEARTPALE